jgi:hypothetical protein
MVDAAPPGIGGNFGLVPQPVHGPCGHRYQIGTPMMSTQTCGCGMFAVGRCSICGKPRCGKHSGFLNGQFVCSIHVAEAIDSEREQVEIRGRELAAQVKDQRETLEQVIEDRYRRLAPELPSGECSVAELRAALERLVPSRADGYTVGYRPWGQAIRVQGWGFQTGGNAIESRVADGSSRIGVIVTTDGRCYQTEDLDPREGEPIPRPEIGRGTLVTRARMPDGWRISEDDIEQIRDQVVEWRELDGRM